MNNNAVLLTSNQVNAMSWLSSILILQAARAAARRFDAATVNEEPENLEAVVEMEESDAGLTSSRAAQ